MAMSVTYVTVHGRLREETRGGVTTRYLGDTLGNVIKTTDTSGNVTSTTTYWPFGEVRTQTGTNPSPWGFCGVWGYLTDAVSRMYVRARHYRADTSCWLSVDPLWPDESAYVYSMNRPSQLVDTNGYSSFGGKAVGCPPSITTSLNALCKMLAGGWAPKEISEINDCVTKSAGKLGIACPKITPSIIKCLGNFCAAGYVGCNDPRLDCTIPGMFGQAISCELPPGGGHNLGSLIAIGWIIGYIPVESPMGGILICPENHNNGAGAGLGGVPGITDTLLHEMLHTCGIGHGLPPAHKPDQRPRGNTSCNGIASCCIYNIQVKRRKGDSCWKSTTW